MYCVCIKSSSVGTDGNSASNYAITSMHVCMCACVRVCILHVQIIQKLKKSNIKK